MKGPPEQHQSVKLFTGFLPNLEKCPATGFVNETEGDKLQCCAECLTDYNYFVHSQPFLITIKIC